MLVRTGHKVRNSAQERGIFMCRVKGNKKWLAVVLFFAVIAASMGRGVTSQAAGKSTKQGTSVSAAKKAKVKKAYKKICTAASEEWETTVLCNC